MRRQLSRRHRLQARSQPAPALVLSLSAIRPVPRSIQMVHDDVKDKPYELELSWICPEVRAVPSTRRCALPAHA